jgi:2'-phosphotransferase
VRFLDIVFSLCIEWLPAGMRNSSQILIFIDVEKALRAGISFSLSDNGVILTEGDENGFLSTEFFLRVEDAQQNAILDWKDTENPI